MKNKILKTITGIAGTLFLLTGCMLDSMSSAPMIIWFISLAWLVLFFYANRERFGYVREQS